MEENKVQRLVGIDFGTSTSLIRVKRYQGDQPVGDSYNVSAVTYGNGAGDSKAVTLVRHNADDTFSGPLADQITKQGGFSRAGWANDQDAA